MAELHYVSSGNVKNPPVVFLHGFMGSLADWTEITERLDRDFFCVCVDLPGHGRSIGLSDASSYTMEGAAERLIGVLDDATVERTHVVGYSMGGRTALYFAVHFPSRCRKLVLESASPGLETEPERAERRGIDEARANRLETEDFLEFLDEWYDQPLFRTYRERPDLMRRMISSRSENDPAELARSLRGMGTGRQPSLWDHLSEMALPVLAVAGALDGKYVEIAKRMAVLMPNVRTAIIPNAGHNLHAERPHVYTDFLKDFLKKPS